MPKIDREILRILRYNFKDERLLEMALTHSSLALEAGYSYERLEFLGDAVLELVSSDFLFREHAAMPEGRLTQLRASLVCEQSLFQFAQKIQLGDYLHLGKGEEHTGGRERPSIVSDAFEAVIASIYLDGGLEEAKKFVLRFIPEHMDVKRVNALSDYKTALQEIIQKNREEKIEYVLVSEVGPDHDKAFTIEVHLNSNVIGTGRGKSKKQAEQLAAKEALQLMGYEA